MDSFLVEKVPDGVVREFFSWLTTVASAGTHESLFVITIGYWLMAHGTTTSRDLVSMDDTSIAFLSPLGKHVHAALPTVQMLPSHRSFLRRAAKVPNALAGQGEEARTVVNTLAPASTDALSMSDDGAPSDMQAILTQV